MLFNVTYVANASGVVQFLQRTNTELVLNMYGILLLIAIFMIILIAVVTITNHPGKGIATASFATFTLSLFLRALELVPNLAVLICLLLAAASIAMLKSS